MDNTKHWQGFRVTEFIRIVGGREGKLECF